MKRLHLMILMMSVVYAGRVDICIDPGHGGSDPGAVNPRVGQNGPYEKDFNFDIAYVMADDLYWVLGYTVSMTRFSDVFVGLNKRVKMANGIIPNPYTGGADTCSYFVSVHNNGSTDRYIHGTETYYSKPADKDYATTVHNKMFNYISFFPFAQNKGVKQRGLWVIRKTNSPACLTESAFVTHDISFNAQWYQLSQNQGGFKDYVALGIDDGLNTYYKFPGPRWLRIPQIFDTRQSLTLEWGECPSAVTAYNIYRRAHPGAQYSLIAENIQGTSYVDNTVNNSTIYSYYVRGKNASGYLSSRSNIVTGQISPYVSGSPTATSGNTGSRLIYDADEALHLAWTDSSGVWYSVSQQPDSWQPACALNPGVEPDLAVSTEGETYICYRGNLGEPDSAAQEPITYIIGVAFQNDNAFWQDEILYTTNNQIIAMSFDIAANDTGWVIFNELDDDGVNTLRIGKFHLNTPEIGLVDTMVLDSYPKSGQAALAIREVDNSLWIAYNRNNIITCKWRDTQGTWHSQSIQQYGRLPSLCVQDNYIFFVWEKYSMESNERSVQSSFTNGTVWSRTTKIADLYAEYSNPFINNGLIATWMDLNNGKWEVYASRCSNLGTWTPPENISHSSAHSRYPQVACHELDDDTIITYVWTEGDQAPYTIATVQVSTRKNSSNPDNSSAANAYVHHERNLLRIQLDSKRNAKITIKLYNVTGRLVGTVLDDVSNNEGQMSVSYACNHLANGVYFVHIHNGGSLTTHKVVMCR
jgi:N-acetylmuramoyl-L-alanine amidase